MYLLFRHFIGIFIVRLRVRELSFAFQKTIVRTSLLISKRARPCGDFIVKNIIIFVSYILSVYDCKLLIFVILIYIHMIRSIYQTKFLYVTCQAQTYTM